MDGPKAASAFESDAPQSTDIGGHARDASSVPEDSCTAINNSRVYGRECHSFCRSPADRQDFRLGDDLSPYRHFRLHVNRELSRTLPARHYAKLQELRLDPRRGHHCGDFLLKQVDDWLRRTRRRKYAGHGLGLLILNAELVKRRN